MREGWARDAACAGMDPSIFFPERGQNRAVDEAKAVCARCPVIDDCREVHMRETEGIWFGTSAIERKRLRRRVAGGRPGPPRVLVGQRYHSDAEHGTRSRFVSGCHCEACEAEDRVYQRERGRRRR